MDEARLTPSTSERCGRWRASKRDGSFGVIPPHSILFPSSSSRVISRGWFGDYGVLFPRVLFFPRLVLSIRSGDMGACARARENTKELINSLIFPSACVKCV
jgi:hypothetical protein